jgi:uncharacterized protein (TIGR00730 family)
MGVLADAVREHGGEVIGVIPAPLATKELVHTGLTELKVVGSMHERKATMAALADAFLALPGGLGTLEETLEMLTWVQLGIHAKPVGIFNVAGYFDPLLQMLTRGAGEGFLHRENAGLLVAADSAAELLDRFTTWRPPATRRVWLTPRQS